MAGLPAGAETAAARRATRWFWALLVVAVLAMGAVYDAWRGPAGPVAAVTVLLAGSVTVAATVQAARILAALRRPQPAGRRPPDRRTGSRPGRPTGPG